MAAHRAPSDKSTWTILVIPWHAKRSYSCSRLDRFIIDSAVENCNSSSKLPYIDAVAYLRSGPRLTKRALLYTDRFCNRAGDNVLHANREVPLCHKTAASMCLRVSTARSWLRFPNDQARTATDGKTMASEPSNLRHTALITPNTTILK